MSGNLPAFNDKGYLPPGTYALTVDELASSMLVVGPETRSEAWDEGHRRRLVENLRILVRQLWGAGITDIFIDGSFVTDKDHPGDIDGYFVCDFMDLQSGQLEQRLNAQSLAAVWSFNQSTWRFDPGHGPKPGTWFAYSIEFYWDWVNAPASVVATLNGKPVPQFFRETRLDEPRGIVQVVR